MTVLTKEILYVPTLAEIKESTPRPKTHDLVATPNTTLEEASWAKKIINRLKEEYPKGKFHCICECCDSSITKEGAEIWQNYTSIKVMSEDQSKYAIFETDFCPICGRELPTPDGGTESNEFNII